MGKTATITLSPETFVDLCGHQPDITLPRQVVKSLFGGWSAQERLFFAVPNHKPNSIKALVKLGASVNAVEDRLGMTPLMNAAQSGTPETVNVLLSLGAHVNAKNKAGRTALMIASVRGDTLIVKLLLDAGADTKPKAKDFWGFSALMCAANNARADVIEMLLAAGANPIAKSKVGQTAREFIRELADENPGLGWRKCVKLLERAEGAIQKLHKPRGVSRRGAESQPAQA